MSHVKSYYRPETVAQALELLSQEGSNAALLGGGTSLVPELGQEAGRVVDLQDACLAEIEHGRGQMTAGAMTRLQTLVDDEQVPALLRETARHEGPNTFRHQATLGGVVASAHWLSELLAALLVFEATLTVETAAGSHNLTLEDFLDDVPGYLQNGIITTITLETDGSTAHRRVARTPKDYPIVAAVARRTPAGTLRLALTGVADRPLLVSGDRLEQLQPPADFRGSSEYRLEMARLLCRRVLAELE